METEALIALKDHLEIFRKEYHSTKVNVFANCLVYKTADNHSLKAADMANDLINKLSLPLIAESTTTFRKDSFIVKAK